MFPLEHSAIPLTRIKRQLVLKTNFWSFMRPFYTGFTVVLLTVCKANSQSRKVSTFYSQLSLACADIYCSDETVWHRSILPEPSKINNKYKTHIFFICTSVSALSYLGTKRCATLYRAASVYGG